MPSKITIVTIITERKTYCLEDLLKGLSGLARPDKAQLSYLIIVAGELSEANEQIIKRFDAENKSVEIERGPDIVEFEGDTYWRSLVAGELRERARKRLMQRRSDWVLWVDCDVILEPDTLVKLLAHGRAMVSGMVLNRSSAHIIAGMVRWDPDTEMPPEAAWTAQSGPQEVMWVGFGCLLVRGGLAREVSFGPYLKGEAPVWLGEDGYWCLEATKVCGELVLLDTTVKPWHVDDTGLSVSGDWAADGTFVRRLRVIGVNIPQRVFLVSRISGLSHRFGLLAVGQPFWTDARGVDLTEDEMREIAADSQFLDIVGAES